MYRSLTNVNVYASEIPQYSSPGVFVNKNWSAAYSCSTERIPNMHRNETKISGAPECRAFLPDHSPMKLNQQDVPGYVPYHCPGLFEHSDGRCGLHLGLRVYACTRLRTTLAAGPALATGRERRQSRNTTRIPERRADTASHCRTTPAFGGATFRLPERVHATYGAGPGGLVIRAQDPRMKEMLL